MQTFYEDKEKDVRIGINHFNRKPKKGINYLIDTGVLDEYDAEGICKFLREEPGINKQKIGEYLGDLRNPLSMDVLQLFVRTIPMEGKEVDDALRLFQTFFRMP
ncbi:IQ motif and SEC7 domain-containing 1-like isoform X1, partial [Paramuricea clavata]